MGMEKIFLLLAALIVTGVSHATCGCKRGYVDWKTAARTSKNVFAAKLISVDSTGIAKKGTFQITKSFRGTAPKLVYVFDLNGDCAQPLTDFPKDKVFLFVSPEFSEYGETKNIFSPSICTKAIDEESNPKIIKWLNSKEFKRRVGTEK
jgi:hypothetical protein